MLTSHMQLQFLAAHVVVYDSMLSKYLCIKEAFILLVENVGC